MFMVYPINLQALGIVILNLNKTNIEKSALWISVFIIVQPISRLTRYLFWTLLKIVEFAPTTLYDRGYQRRLRIHKRAWFRSLRNSL